MKILAIIGSQRAGNTLKAVESVEKELRKYDNALDFEYVKLWKDNVQLCKGCFLCLKSGIENCPINDDVAEIVEKMLAADGVIFASPVYVMSVTANMKNFIDRISAFCHRPAFFHQKALVVSTVGGIGLGRVLKYLKEVTEVIGMQPITKLGLTTPPLKNFPERLRNKNDEAVKKAAAQFWNNLQKTNINPSFNSVLQFEAQKVVFYESADEEDFPADCQFYSKLKKNNYWVEADVAWYKTLTAKAFAKLIKIVMK